MNIHFSICSQNYNLYLVTYVVMLFLLSSNISKLVSLKLSRVKVLLKDSVVMFLL